MVRHWFSLAAVLAVAVLIVATDASQSRERRFGRRARRNSNANVEQVSAPYYYDSAGRLVSGSMEQTAMAGTQSASRTALYPPEGQPMRAQPVRLEVRVPANAEIWIDGARTMQNGPVREFISPPIEPGRSYAYELKMKWTENGAERERVRNVSVRPGQLVRVDLTQASEASE
jgi:uncharacterized protein (TIGR03000 family)